MPVAVTQIVSIKLSLTFFFFSGGAKVTKLYDAAASMHRNSCEILIFFIIVTRRMLFCNSMIYLHTVILYLKVLKTCKKITS